MPKIRELTQMPPMAEGDAEAQVDALRDYLLRITEELTYLLTHLEADNINDSTFERIAGMIPKAAITAPPMDGQGSAGSSATWARGDHQHPKDRDKADVSALAALAAELAAHVADKLNPHEVTAVQVGYDNSESGLVSETVQDAMDEAIALAISLIPTDPADIGAIPASEKGLAGGVAELDSSGHVPSSQLPSYVDDVLEYPSITDFPIPGESGKIYLAIDTNLFYRWGGTTYGPTNPSLALGETSETAYRGDRGKAAYDHSQTTSGNPHNVSASDVGLGNVANERQYSAQNPPPLPTPADIGAATAQDLTDHVGDTNNPHSVTAAQVGLDQVANERQYSVNNPPPAPDAEDVPYDNTQSGLMATDVQAAIDEIAQGGGGGGTAASAVSYDNTGSGLTATNVQDAIDEVYGDIPTQPSDIGAQDTITASGILKGDGQGGVSAATAGTDYQAPLTAGTDYATPAQLADKANQAQLAYVETGTTASRNYSAGEYICWNGLTYTANQAISSGTTLSADTGGNLTECVGGGFNDVQSFNVSPASGVTINSQSNYKIGNLVFLYSEFNITSDLPGWSPVYTLPFPAFFGSFYLAASGAMPVSQVLYSSNNYTISKGRNALPAGTYLVSVMGCITR